MKKRDWILPSRSSLSLWIHKSSAYSEVTKLYVSSLVNQYVRGLHVSVEIMKTISKRSRVYKLSVVTYEWPRVVPSDIIMLSQSKKNSSHRQDKAMKQNIKTLTASVTCRRMDSLIGFWVRFWSLSKQVDISSMQIQTSASVMKQPRHWTMYGQSCDLRTTSKSIVILFVSSSLPVRRIC